MKYSFDVNVPKILVEKVYVSKPYENINASGYTSSYGIDLKLPEMNLSKTIKTRDLHLLKGKIEETLRNWEAKYTPYIAVKSVDEMNKEVEGELKKLQSILSHTLKVNDEINWDKIKRDDTFHVDPEKLFDENKSKPGYIKFDESGYPVEFIKQVYPAKPDFEKFKKGFDIITKLLRRKDIVIKYEIRFREWEREVEEIKQENASREVFYNRAVAIFYYHRLIGVLGLISDKKKFEEEKKLENDALENTKQRYKDSHPDAVEEYCDLVLNSSEYPDYFPHDWVLEYRKETKMVLVEYSLPAPSKLPKIESYKYIKSRNEMSEKLLSDTVRKKLYDDVIYQICLRTIHELFEADVVNALEAVAFNGIVTSTNPATGIEETKVIMSIMAEKEEFMAFDLSKIDPRATFKHLKGISATTLVDLTPIPPIINLDKSDKRFISGREVADSLDESINIAAMHWDDFEHLVRELFEKEFTVNGGEVKVTQASADGGVDAIAYDPDPIRGGKIVIQAKRYTNVVGVSAVRDLYGTVLNEGATKGILVTTSDYGKDSYAFAKDKPITLLNGNNLLALLEKHGHKARINVAEARMLINSQNEIHLTQHEKI